MRHSRLATQPIPLRRHAGRLVLLGLAAALLAGCQTDGKGTDPISELANYSARKPEPAEPPKPPMTRARAASDCWMSTEKGRADANLDRRADIVTKCIEDKMKKADAPPKN